MNTSTCKLTVDYWHLAGNYSKGSNRNERYRYTLQGNSFLLETSTVAWCTLLTFTANSATSCLLQSEYTFTIYAMQKEHQIPIAKKYITNWDLNWNIFTCCEKLNLNLPPSESGLATCGWAALFSSRDLAECTVLDWYNYKYLKRPN